MASSGGVGGAAAELEGEAIRDAFRARRSVGAVRTIGPTLRAGGAGSIDTASGDSGARGVVVVDVSGGRGAAAAIAGTGAATSTAGADAVRVIAAPPIIATTQAAARTVHFNIAEEMP